MRLYKISPIGLLIKDYALQLLIEGGVRSEDLSGKFAIIGWDTKAVVDANNGQVDRFRTFVDLEVEHFPVWKSI